MGYKTQDHGHHLQRSHYYHTVFRYGLKYEHNRKKYIRVQRLINISMAKAYRTTSSEALCMLTGMTPTIIKLEEIVKRCKAKESDENSKTEMDVEVELKTGRTQQTQ